MTRRFAHPADLAAYIAESHGHHPGGPPDRYGPEAPASESDPPLTQEPPGPRVHEDFQRDEEVARALEKEPASVPEQPTHPVAGPPPSGDFILLDDKVAHFLGYDVALTLGEVEDIKQVLAGAVVRTLDEHKARVRQAVPRKGRG